MLKKIFAVLVLALLVLAAAGGLFFYHLEKSKPAPVGAVTPVPEGEGWIDLLDADHAANWKNLGNDKKLFDINNGELHIFGASLHPLGYATYAGQEFEDFKIHLEFKLTKGANSGLFVRSIPNDPVYRGFEIQIQDDFGKAPNKNSCGALYDVATPMFNMVKPAGEWNSYDITLQGKDLEVFLNGWRVLHIDLAKMITPLGKFKVAYNEMQLSGHLMLQDHGGEVWYRNIRIYPLAAAPAEQPL